MISNTEELLNIRKTMDDNGCICCGIIPQESKTWFISIEWASNGYEIHHCFFLCETEAKTKAAVKYLLDNTDCSSVVVHSPIHTPVTFYETFGKGAERDWKYYFH